MGLYLAYIHTPVRIGFIILFDAVKIKLAPYLEYLHKNMLQIFVVNVLFRPCSNCIFSVKLFVVQPTEQYFNNLKYLKKSIKKGVYLDGKQAKHT